MEGQHGGGEGAAAPCRLVRGALRPLAALALAALCRCSFLPSHWRRRSCAITAQCVAPPPSWMFPEHHRCRGGLNATAASTEYYNAQFVVDVETGLMHAMYVCAAGVWKLHGLSSPDLLI